MKKFKLGIRYFLIFITLIFFLFPIYWMITTSFKPADDWFKWPPILLPTRFTFESYGGSPTEVYKAASVVSLVPYMRNSFIIASLTAILSTLISVSAAFVISRFKVGGMRLINWVISTRIIPPIVVLIPLYIIFQSLRLLDTWWSVIIVYTIYMTSLGTFVLIVFFNTIPKELDEAAYLDGCGPFKTLIHVLIPAALPGIISITLLSFLFSWSEFLIALILTNTENSQTLPVFVGRYITGFQIAWGPISAAGTLIMLPAIILAYITLRYLITGLTFGAVKG